MMFSLTTTLSLLALPFPSDPGPEGPPQPRSETPRSSGFLEPDVEVLATYFGSPGESLGGILRRLGDLNGDGKIEWAACGPFHDRNERRRAGRVIVVDGATGTILREHFGRETNAELTGPMVGPDLDGDGRREYSLMTGGTSPVARAWTFSGDLSLGPEAALLDELFDPDPTTLTAYGEDAGDVDGDGVGDLFRQAEYGMTLTGSGGFVDIVSGRDPSVTLRHHEGGRDGDRFGNMAGTLGDLDGDGQAEYWIGAPQSNPPQTRGYVRLYDGATGTVRTTLRPNQSWGAVFSLFYAYTTNDVSGDGLRDLFIADTGDFRRGLETGRVYVFDSVSGAKLWGKLGSGGDQGFGISHPFGFDVTGDGIDELVVGSYLASEGANNAGKVQLLDGSDGTILRTITSTTAGETFGSDVIGIDDMDGDGYLEIVVSAWINDEAGQDAGKLYVISGGLGGATTTDD